jgi:hypothetical protein
MILTAKNAKKAAKYAKKIETFFAILAPFAFFAVKVFTVA